MKVKLNSLSEEYFIALRIPFESGRQSPDKLGGMLILGALLQALMFFLTYIVVGESTGFPFKQELLIFHLIITIIIIIGALIFCIPKIYKRNEVLQYIFVILVTLNTFGIPFYLCAIFAMWPERILLKNEPIVIKSIIITCLAGATILIYTWFRFMRLLKKGDYKEGSKKDKLRSTFEAKSLIVPGIIIGTTFSLFLQNLFKTITTFDGHVWIVIIFGPLLFYTMLFILPEQIVLVYCKKRFKSFTFNEAGNLYPIGSGDTKAS